MTLTNSTLRLWNAVRGSNKSSEPLFLKDLGVLLSGDAQDSLEEVQGFYWTLGANALNSTLRDWQSAKEVFPNNLQNLDQLFHYLGFPVPSRPSPDYSLPVKVVRGMSPKEMVEKAFEMLQVGTGLKGETLQDLSLVLKHHSELAEKELHRFNIQNREARVLLADLFGAEAVSVDPFHWLWYKATGETYIINSPVTLAKVKNTDISVEEYISEKDLIHLSRSFNRYKWFWMTLKGNQSEAGRKLINRVSKLSKKHHTPWVTPTLKQVANASLSEVAEAAKKASIKELVGAVNGLRGAKEHSRMFHIRNGKSWVKSAVPASTEIQSRESLLLQELKSRPCPAWWDVNSPIKWAIPCSQKQMVGGLPMGTLIPFPTQNLLVGVTWSGNDLDLSALSENGKIGWNALAYTSEATHSGDVVRGETCAEWLWFSHISKPYLIVLNEFEAGNSDVRLVIGKSPEAVDKNYTINPDDILTSISLPQYSGQNYIGVIAPEGLYLFFRGIGSGKVSSTGDLTKAVAAALISQAKNMLKFEEVWEPNPNGAKLSLDSTPEDSCNLMKGMLY